MATIYHSFPGRITADMFKKQITAIIDVWEDWIVFPSDFTTELRERLEGIPGDEKVEVEEKQKDDKPAVGTSRFKTSGFKLADTQVDAGFAAAKEAAVEDLDGAPMNDDLDGDPLDDVDGAPLDDVDGAPLDDIDGAPLDDIDGSPMNDDVDGIPLNDDLDGAPMDDDLDDAPMDDLDGAPLQDDEPDGTPVKVGDGAASKPESESDGEPMDMDDD